METVTEDVQPTEVATDTAGPADPKPAPQEQALEPRRTTAALVGFGIVPQNLEDAYRFAKMLAGSDLVPKDYRGKPENCIVAMQYGAEIGLPPMASLQSVAVINGKPGVYGDGFLAVIMSKPAYAKHVEYYELADGRQVKGLSNEDLANDATKAVAKFWRKGNTDPFVAEFSIADAKRAKLWGKEGPWSQYPARQMKWRARGFAGRDGFAVELRGVKMAEELLDYHDEPIVDSGLPPAEPVRRSERAQLEAARETVASTESSTPAAATPATAKATDKAPRSTGQTQTSTAHIGATKYVTPKDGDPYYELEAKVGQRQTIAYVTRDQQIAELLNSCEGSPTLFTLTWQQAKDAQGKPVRLLTAVTAAE